MTIIQLTLLQTPFELAVGSLVLGPRRGTVIGTDSTRGVVAGADDSVMAATGDGT